MSVRRSPSIQRVRLRRSILLHEPGELDRGACPCFRFYGGVTRIIQCDNLKTCVISHGKSEIVLNKAYNDLAEHYSTAIIPCRAKAPQDKALVERTVGIVTNYILGALRNRQFLSLPELNEAIFDRLNLLNHKPYQKEDSNRASDFEEEKPFLRPLPDRPFELAEWKIATVGPNMALLLSMYRFSDGTVQFTTAEVFNQGDTHMPCKRIILLRQ